MISEIDARIADDTRLLMTSPSFERLFWLVTFRHFFPVARQQRPNFRRKEVVYLSFSSNRSAAIDPRLSNKEPFASNFGRLIDDAVQESIREPFTGIGKPEPLRHQLSGCWSRRIDREHRLVYQVARDTITFLQCRARVKNVNFSAMSERSRLNN